MNRHILVIFSTPKGAYEALGIPADPSETNDYTALTVGAAAFVVGSIAAVIAWGYRADFDTWLGKSKNRRTGFRCVFLYVLPVILAGLADWADMSEVFEGRSDSGDIVRLAIGGLATAVWIGAQVFEGWHVDQWDSKLRKAKLEAQSAAFERNRALSARDFLLDMSAIFVRIVALKAKRVRAALEARPHKESDSESLARIRTALLPQDQMGQLVVALQGYYSGKTGAEFSARVALYAREENYMRAIHSFDGTTVDSIQSPNKKWRDRFCLENPDMKCLVVRSVLHDKILIVPNADKENDMDEGIYRHFDDKHRENIKSIIAIPLSISRELDRVTSVVTIDTNKVDFFEKEMLPDLKRLRENIAHRLLFEQDMKELLQETESDGR